MEKLLKTNLYRHQEDAVSFAIKNNAKCAIFHEPGLGKTRTCLEIFKHYKAKEPHLRLLVVCPLSLINSAWGEDIKKFTSFSYLPFKTLKNTLPDILIINYEALISIKYILPLQKLIQGRSFMCVLDESARLKNHKSLTARELLGLSRYFKYRLIASGCPFPNSELELWAQINFIQPGVLHSSFYAFRNTYFHLERNGQTYAASGKIMTRDVMRQILSHGWRYSITEEKRKELMDTIEPFTHWVKKKDALDLPEKIDQVREVKLNRFEQEAYTQMRDYLVAEIKGKEIVAQVALTKLMKLRQATSGFFYAEDGKTVVIGSNPSKLKELMEIIEELGREPVIIWANFKQEIQAILARLRYVYGQDCAVTLYSDTDDRDDALTKFKTGQARFIIAHPASMAHGVTLTNCSTQIFYSISYSYEQYMQARDRIHRISQNKTCLYIHLIAKDTIDEQILAVVQKKQSIQDVVYQILGDKHA